MQALFDAVNAVCDKIQVVSDLFWDFPTNFDWYANIPILGNFSLAIILLIGSGIFFTCQLRFIQVRKFRYGIRVLKEQKAKTGISPWASFLLSTAMRVGPGNILGVTGAISVGGPGALFWMWVSAFFGMATAYTESTLSQIFKEKKGDEYIGGLPFYGRRLLKGAVWAGVALSVLYIVYALLCFPAQGFNTISAVGSIASILTGTEIATNSALYWISFAALIVVTAVVSFGGVRKVAKVTDVLVPIMAVIYVLTVLVLIVVNFVRIPGSSPPSLPRPSSLRRSLAAPSAWPWPRASSGASCPTRPARGTITMPAAASDAKHPCDQGCVQALGVFLDTIVICTLTGFVVIMGRVWLTNGADAWFEMDKLPRFLASCAELTPGTAFNSAVTLLVTLCFGLFAFTCLMGFMSFTEICANRISQKKAFINVIRVLCLVVISFGVVTDIAGMDLASLWNLSDFANILIALCNLPCSIWASTT